MAIIPIITGWGYSGDAASKLAERLADRHTVYPRTCCDDTPPQQDQTPPRLLCGWSHGGQLCLQRLSGNGTAAEALILISSTARFCSCDGYACGVDRTRLRSMKIGLPRNRKQTLDRFYRDAAFPDLLTEHESEYRHACAMCFTDEQLQSGLAGLDSIDLRGALPSVTVPVLILHGALDKIVPVSAARFLAGNLPRARIHIHPEAGHELILRQADWAADRIAEFVDSL